MTVATDSPHHTVHTGQEYRFCSAGCRSKFVADPARYLQSNLAADETTPAGTQYTCPMHPQIVRDAPGACPLCGMALEPMMPSLDDDENPQLADFRRRFWWTLPLSLAVLALAMLGHRTALLTATARTWIELALTAPVVLWAGWPFFVRWAQSIATPMTIMVASGRAAQAGVLFRDAEAIDRGQDRNADAGPAGISRGDRTRVEIGRRGAAARGEPRAGDASTRSPMPSSPRRSGAPSRCPRPMSSQPP